MPPAGWRRGPGLAHDDLAWAGLAALSASVFLFGRETPFPFAWALLPVLGAVAVDDGKRAVVGNAPDFSGDLVRTLADAIALDAIRLRGCASARGYR